MSTVREISAVVEVDSVEKEIISLEYNDGYRTPISKVKFETDTASIDWLGEPVSVTLARDAYEEEVFTGYVDDVNYARLPGVYDVTCSNDLIRAQNHWIVVPDIEGYWERSSIAAEDLVRDLLLEAGLSDYSGATSSFTFGTQGPAQFQLVAVMDAINQINQILAYNIWMDGSTVMWDRVFPVPEGSPSITVDGFINISQTTGTSDLRNKVIVFGKNGIYAEDSAVSPYLPAGFYQTAIVSSELIDTQTMASQSAGYNLELYNKLNQELRVDIEGDPRIKVMDTIHVEYAPFSINEDWFVYAVRHTFGTTYTTALTLRK